MRKADGTLSDNSTFVFADVPIGGGGYASSIESNAWGDLVLGTDTTTCAVRRKGEGTWVEVFTTDTLTTEADYHPVQAKSLGRYATNFISWAPSSRQRLYAAFNSYFFTVDLDPAKALSEPGAITCTKWNLASKYMDCGAGYNRWWSKAIAVHPTLPNTVLIGTDNDGCYYTTDAGANVTSITIPAGSGLVLGGVVQAREVGRERYLVLSDKADGNYWYIFVQGTGLYRSSTGVAGAFSAVTGGPTSATDLAIGTDGRLWITGDERIGAQGGLWKLARGAATSCVSLGNPIGSTNYPWHVAVDPFSNDSVILHREQIGAYTINGGTNWTSQNATLNAGGEAVWRQTGAPKLAGGMAFDPTDQDTVYWAEGFGCCYTLNYKAATMALLDYSIGVEQKIHTGFLSVPNGGPLLVSGMDAVACRIDSLTSYINRPADGPVEAGGIQPAGNPPDYAIDDPDYLVLSMGYGDNHGFNEHGGDYDKWHKFTGTLSAVTNPSGWDARGACGDVAVSNRGNIILCPSNVAVPSYSQDGGATWTRIELGGSYDYCTNQAFFIRGRKIVSSDKTRPGAFAMVVMTVYPNTQNYTNPAGGLWVTLNNGTSWTQKCTGNIGHPGLTQAQVSALGQESQQYYKCQLAYVPGRSQNLLYTPFDTILGTKFWYSPDDGATWTELNTLVRNVVKFAFGKHYDSAYPYPAVYFYGTVSGVTGSWVTFDWFATFKQISPRFAATYIGGVNAIGADLNNFGVMLASVEGKGSVYASCRDVVTAT